MTTIPDPPELADLIDASFDDGPAHRPLHTRLAAGHRVLCRRRQARAGVAVAAAVAAIALTPIVLTTQEDGAAPVLTGPTATAPTPTATTATTTTPGTPIPGATSAAPPSAQDQTDLQVCLEALGERVDPETLDEVRLTYDPATGTFRLPGPGGLTGVVRSGDHGPICKLDNVPLSTTRSEAPEGTVSGGPDVADGSP